MKNITPVLLVIFILLTIYNTYKIYTLENTRAVVASTQGVDVSTLSQKIDVNAKEILNGVQNVKTIADFINAKFESYHPTITTQ